jgi:hypothetical protein
LTATSSVNQPSHGANITGESENQGKKGPRIVMMIRHHGTFHIFYVASEETSCPMMIYLLHSSDLQGNGTFPQACGKIAILIGSQERKTNSQAELTSPAVESHQRWADSFGIGRLKVALSRWKLASISWYGESED